MPFHVTSAAAQEVLAAAGRSGATGMALRVAAKHTPEGIAYGMGFDEAAPDDCLASQNLVGILRANGAGASHPPS